MTRIKQLVEQFEEELDGAKTYAECYVDYKSKNNTTWANRFKEMANDELKHAGYVHDLAVQEVNTLSEAIKVPVEMQENWKKAHTCYVEKAAWVKLMLTL